MCNLTTDPLTAFDEACSGECNADNSGLSSFDSIYSICLKSNFF